MIPKFKSYVIEQGEHYLEVDELYVRPENRSDNIGHVMVDKLLEAAEGNGIKIIGFNEKCRGTRTKSH
ncbi:GNAT family N-acetyltransferase [Paenibacillus lautus]|uniref:GNAT family N-acetyltransferase n=1 Tax=Paenibacillus lautus TaxID=1401 RepID=UPI00398AD576